MDYRIDRTLAETFAGVMEDARGFGLQWVTFEVADNRVTIDNWSTHRDAVNAYENAAINGPGIRVAEIKDLLPELYKIIDQPNQRLSKKQHNHKLKFNVMNTENLNYLQKQLLNLGFGEKLNEELETNIKSGKKEFTLTTDLEYNKQNVDYTLHYKAGDNNEMYFFNKYDASLRDKEMQQTFYINKGSGITAKEAYNLMDGRAVHKQLENLQGEKYNAWIVIDKENKTENGNFKLRPFTDGWNYKPERAIDKLDIVGIGEEGARDKLMKSLEKGNRHQVTAMKDGKEVKLYLETNPAEHRVNLTNWKGEAQQLEHYKKPEFKNDVKKDQKQAQTAEDAPAKKPRKSAKMKV